MSQTTPSGVNVTPPAASGRLDFGIINQTQPKSVIAPVVHQNPVNVDQHQKQLAPIAIGTTAATTPMTATSATSQSPGRLDFGTASKSNTKSNSSSSQVTPLNSTQHQNQIVPVGLGTTAATTPALGKPQNSTGENQKQPMPLTIGATAASTAPAVVPNSSQTKRQNSSNIAEVGAGIVNTTMAAGKAVLKEAPFPIKAIPAVTDYITYLADSKSLKSGGTTAIANYVAPQVLAAGAQTLAKVAVVGGAELGPQMAVAAVGYGSFWIGEHYIAPYVAPQLGNLMYNVAPGLFTPH